MTVNVNKTSHPSAKRVRVEITLDDDTIHDFTLIEKPSQPITVEYGWHAEPIETHLSDRYVTRAPGPVSGHITVHGPMAETGINVTRSTSLPVVINGHDRPPVIVLCGSTRFKDEINEANRRFTLEDNIVISMGVFGHVDMPEAGLHITDSSPTKVMLDELHKRKIDLADLVYVVNPGGYIGESTRGEIAYAQQHSIPVQYLEPVEERPS